jgi:hypothetical protein
MHIRPISLKKGRLGLERVSPADIFKMSVLLRTLENLLRTLEHSAEREELVQCCTIPLHSDQKQISNSAKSARILHELIEILEIPGFRRSSVRILLESY